MSISFPSIGGLCLWADSFGGWLDENPVDRNLPYVIKGNLFHYFGFDGENYNLVMMSEKDLGAKK